MGKAMTIQQMEDIMKDTGFRFDISNAFGHPQTNHSIVVKGDYRITQNYRQVTDRWSAYYMNPDERGIPQFDNLTLLGKELKLEDAINLCLKDEKERFKTEDEIER